MSQDDILSMEGILSSARPDWMIVGEPNLADDSAQQNARLADSGLACLLVIAGMHGLAVDEAQLRREFGGTPFSTDEIILAARGIGLAARRVRQDRRRWERVPFPAIAWDLDKSYCIVARYEPLPTGRLLAMKPGSAPN